MLLLLCWGKAGVADSTHPSPAGSKEIHTPTPRSFPAHTNGNSRRRRSTTKTSQFTQTRKIELALLLRMARVSIVRCRRVHTPTYLALMAGSSQQGKARLASVASNWVTAMVLVSPSGPCSGRQKTTRRHEPS